MCFCLAMMAEFETVHSLSTKLQFKAAELLINLKDESYSTKKIFNLVTKGVDDLYNILIHIIKSKFLSFGQEYVLSVPEICSVLTQMEGNSLFEGLHSPEQLSKFVDQKRGLVQPVAVHVGHMNVLAGNEVKKVATDTGYVVPFLSMLEALLNCPEVLHCVDNPRPSVAGVFKTPLDGYAYQKHPLVLKYPGTLGIRTYDDDAQLTDTSSSQDVSIRLMYWTLLNTYPELRSSNRAIQLLGCVKTSVIKAKGHKVFMNDFIEAMKKLSTDKGVDLTIKGNVRTFRAVLVDHNADNPAAASLGGFKESHFASCYCRQCTVSKEDMFMSFDENDFVRRTMESHQVQVAEVEEYIETKANKRPNPSVKYGINRRSAFMDIPHVDVTKCFPQDLMHDVILGTLKQEVVCLLLHVLEKKKTTLKAINDKVASLVKYFGVNKPAPIETSHLENNKLRQSASEMLGLAYILPFALLDKNNERVCDEANHNCYILRLNLLSLQMSDVFTEEDIMKLRKMTVDHHTRFQALYPGKEIPKLHFEAHLPTQIYLYGPLRQQWCFRFEGKHAYFKRICRLIHNYVNICESLSTRHQERQCGLMMLPEPYLHVSDRRGAPRAVVLQQCMHQELLKKVFPTDNDGLQEYKYIDQSGVHYTKGSAFVSRFMQEVPVCGEIVSIYGNKDQLAFVYAKLNTLTYDVNFNAFKVAHTEELDVVLTKDLAYRHHIPFIRGIGSNYLILQSKSYLAKKY